MALEPPVSKARLLSGIRHCMFGFWAPTLMELVQKLQEVDEELAQKSRQIQEAAADARHLMGAEEHASMGSKSRSLGGRWREIQRLFHRSA